MDSIKDSIKKLAGTKDLDIPIVYYGQVDSVDESSLTCSVRTTNAGGELILTKVRLTASVDDGEILIPDIDSEVIVISTNTNGRYLVKTSALSKWSVIIDKNNSLDASSSGFIFNDGNNGGLIKINDLVSQLNAVENKVNTIIAAIAAAPIAPTDGGAAFKASVAGAIQPPLVPTQVIQLENNNVKH